MVVLPVKQGMQKETVTLQLLLSKVKKQAPDLGFLCRIRCTLSPHQFDNKIAIVLTLLHYTMCYRSQHRVSKQFHDNFDQKRQFFFLSITYVVLNIGDNKKVELLFFCLRKLFFNQIPRCIRSQLSRVTFRIFF